MQKKVLSILTIAVVVSLSAKSMAASKRVRSPYYGAVVVEAETGRVLIADRARESGYPASVTKLMTFLLYLERLDSGDMQLSDKVYVTQEAARVGARQVWLEANEIFPVEDMLYALMVRSANDVARALALHVSSSRDEFVALMNERAQQLGMYGAMYSTASGLPRGGGFEPDSANAMDISILAREVLKHPLTLEITTTKEREFRPGEHMVMLRPSNKLLGVYPGLDGLKTGYHGLGGWSIAATAERDGERIVAVVLGSPDRVTRDRAATKLLDQGFVELAKIRAAEPKPEPVLEPILEAPQMAEKPLVEETVNSHHGGLWVVIGAVVLMVVGVVGLLRPKEKNTEL